MLLDKSNLNVAIADRSSKYHHVFPDVEYQKEIFRPNYPSEKVRGVILDSVDFPHI